MDLYALQPFHSPTVQLRYAPTPQQDALALHTLNQRHVQQAPLGLADEAASIYQGRMQMTWTTAARAKTGCTSGTTKPRPATPICWPPTACTEN